MPVRRLLICILFSACLFAGGCSASQDDRQTVAEILRIRSRALNTRDAGLYFSVISSKYNHKGKDFIRLKDSLTDNFQTFESLYYQPGEQAIALNGEYAEVDGAYRMKIVVRGKEMVLDGREHLKLAKEPGGWKIIAGL